MLRHSSRLTLLLIEAGETASWAKARTAACRFDISSAAGSPLPAMSAIDTPRTSPKPSVSKQSPPTPSAGSHVTDEIDAGDLRRCGRQQAALDQACLLHFALLLVIAAAGGAAFRDFALDDLDEREVFPRLLHEALGAAPHRFDRRIDAAPPGHDDDRQGRVVDADARRSTPGLLAPRSYRGYSSDPSAAGRTDRCATDP